MAVAAQLLEVVPASDASPSAPHWLTGNCPCVCLLQSKLMVRLEEQGGDVVRLLERTMRLGQQQQQHPAAAAAAGDGKPDEAASGCEVLCEEESRWLLVSDTFAPDVPRWGHISQRHC
jgi:hypothetical protein